MLSIMIAFLSNEADVNALRYVIPINDKHKHMLAVP
jgi:hypothetical protein